MNGRHIKIIGTPVYTIAEGTELGKIEDFIIDPRKAIIVAFVIGDDSQVISFNSIKKFGSDAAIIDSSSQLIDITQNKDLREWLHMKLIDYKVITSDGNFIGLVKKFSFDLDTGKILSCAVESNGTLNDISASQMVSIGSGTLVITSDLNEVVGIIEEKELDQKREEKIKQRAVPLMDELQQDFLLGKKVKNDLLDEDGTLLLKSGETITKDAIEKAKKGNIYSKLLTGAISKAR